MLYNNYIYIKTNEIRGVQVKCVELARRMLCLLSSFNYEEMRIGDQVKTQLSLPNSFVK